MLRPISPARRARRTLAAAGLSLAAACGDQNLIPPAPQDQVDLFWSLALDHHAVAVSKTTPYDTLRLTATPLNYRDEPLAGRPTPQFHSADPDRVVVTSDGLVIGVGRTTQPVAVVATLLVDNLKHVDTAFVQVVDTATPPVLASLSIHPVPPDSAKISVTQTEGFVQPVDTLPVRALAADGGLIPVYPHESAGVLPVHFRSADSNLARVHHTTGVLKGIQVGPATIYATTTAFGVTKADTLVYRVGWPVMSLLFFGPNRPGDPVQLLFPEVRIGTGGAVGWATFLPADIPDSVDITFADADLPNIHPIRPVLDRLMTFNDFAGFWFCADDCDNGGNIMFRNTMTLASAGRHFPVPGTYEYRSERHGFTGRVIVVDER